LAVWETEKVCLRLAITRLDGRVVENLLQSIENGFAVCEGRMKEDDVSWRFVDN
jgi:hypothetical protein